MVLLPPAGRRGDDDVVPTQYPYPHHNFALFGQSCGVLARPGSNHRSKYQPIRDKTDPNELDDEEEEEEERPLRRSQQQQQPQQQHRPKNPESIADFFFGFMYEEDCDDNDNDNVVMVVEQESLSLPRPSWRHPLHLALAMHLFLLSASCAMAVNISMAAVVSQPQYNSNNNNYSTQETAANNSVLLVSTQMTSAAVLGTALGKLLLGPFPDVLGARRTAVGTSLGMAATWLLGMALATSMQVMVWGQLVLEFLNAVQWPCTVVVLAGHHSEGEGIFVTSLVSRLGSLVGMIVSRRFLFVRNSNSNNNINNTPSATSLWHWRLLACVAAWSALVAASVMYLYVQDTPDQRNAPSHPVDAQHLLQKWYPHDYYYYYYGRKQWTVWQKLRWTAFVVRTHVGPAVVRLLTSGPSFWILALAHTGSLVVRTSERILPAYAVATNYLLSTNDAATTTSANDNNDNHPPPPPPLAIYSSVGTVLGLLIVGHLFANQADNPRARKWLVGRLYAVAVVACYVLALLAIPVVVQSMPPELLSFGQVVAVTIAGAAVAVPCYHIPSLVAAQQQQLHNQSTSTTQHDRGLFLAYTDGIAYGLASLVWKFLSGRIAGNSPTGWAYGWSAVALLLLVAGVAMTEFMEHYFCATARTRRYRGGTYETILLA